MKLIVVGAGPVGNALAELACKSHDDVVVIEGNEERAEDCARRYDVKVLHLNIAAPEVLEEAGLDSADALVACTTDDAANLMAVLIGQEAGISTLLSTVNHRGHAKMFEKLGVHILLDPELLVARHLFDVIRLPDAKAIQTMNDGVQFLQLRIAAQAPIIGYSPAQAHEEKLIPENMRIVAVRRTDKETDFPEEFEALRADDELTLVCIGTLDKKIAKTLGPVNN